MPTDDHDKTVIRPSGEPFSADRTVIRPRPGGRPTGPSAPGRGDTVVPPARLRGAGMNPLLDAASTLLALAGQLRGSIAQPDVAGLRRHVVREVQAFETNAKAAGVRPDLVLAARYGMCTVLDEFVLSTPWGSAGPWSQETLLSTFHKETFGGEKFFQILARMQQEPGRNLELLELFYVCIALGFEGQYRVMERGRAQLEQVQDDLYRTIRGQRGDFERDLSPHWRGAEVGNKGLSRYVPLWVVFALAAVLLVAVYVAFSFGLNSASDPVFGRLAGLGREGLALAAPAPAPEPEPVLAPEPVPEEEPRPPTLAELLAPQVTDGSLGVREQPDRSTVILRGDGLFASGSATVKTDLEPLLLVIADALNQLPGKVLVTGHSDSVPIRTLRFPSNYHLSQARAESVVKILGERLSEPSRMVAEGRADTEPVAPNDTPENRARNRRVEITLISTGTRL